MLNLKGRPTNALLNDVWTTGNGMAPAGGYPIEWYLEELCRRDPDIKLHHSDLTVGEKLASVLNEKTTYRRRHGWA